MRRTTQRSMLALAVTAALTLNGCSGDDGAKGADGSDGAQGLVSLLLQTPLYAGNEQCFDGGTRVDSGLDSNNDGELASDEITQTSYLCNATALNEAMNFNRIASFPVCLQLDPSCNVDTETAAEIAAVNDDGTVVVYTDSPLEVVGFVDINDPANPQALGTVALNGEPTSVAVKGAYALVGVNTSADYINVSGALAVIDIASQTEVTRLDLGGQPDSVAVSPDGQFAVIAIENERDEDLGDGAPPQMPAGTLAIVDLSGTTQEWSVSFVDMTGLADLYGDDPEPEYVDINNDNIAVVTLQENNHIVLVDLQDGSVLNHFSAGAVDLTQVDTEEEEAFISQTDSLSGVLREPDGVTWLSNDYFVTANEGDLDGGSRGFTVFNTAGDVIYEAGNTLEHLTARVGHYPDERSGNKGNEPENAEFGVFGDERYLFVNAERASLVFVYDVADLTRPVLKQVLPAATAPEGALAIPSRNLLVVASEEDNRGDKQRSVLNIYAYQNAAATYPTVQSTDRTDGTPIPFAALSGLAAGEGETLWAIEDSFYLSNRIFRIDTAQTPASLNQEIRITDSNGVLAALPVVNLADNSVDEDDATRVSVFDSADLAAMINADNTVNIDPEGIAVASDGGFWIASEGAGTQGDSSRPINSLNLLLKTSSQGEIEQAITLPDAVNAQQVRFGFEGVAEYNGKAYVAFQRAWNGETQPRIGVYDTATQNWQFFFYPLDGVASQNGGWVGLSDLTSLGDDRFLVLERDNQGGPDGAIKRIYEIDTNGVASGQTLTKTLVRDLVSDLTATGGLVAEKVEGLARLSNGDVYIINDNDGVDGVSGEIRLINLGPIAN
ncbi:esterase-like activity of phytase family protein [Aestuariibacter halophilus]|uniref:Esterase-like activity of phytase family protein n=1 Tax=Fluctibacter halophilus TaxID=226011 RepID=A0ABS8G493_9ALTE|nr:esterase-like activity of phytase family protein [Aestuariibacter halophilus]MCC2614951.1 esterase-like activity of phytase family protein [Aestuariibacter halophilus]